MSGISVIYIAAAVCSLLMLVASGQYWNSVHGRKVGEAIGDEEGLQGMRTLAENMSLAKRNMVFLKKKSGR